MGVREVGEGFLYSLLSTTARFRSLEKFHCTEILLKVLCQESSVMLQDSAVVNLRSWFSEHHREQKLKKISLFQGIK